MPELPVFTTFFQMQSSVNYEVDYNVLSSYVIEDIDLYPYQGEAVINKNKQPFIQNLDFYNSNTNFPFVNISVSDPMVMRDIEVSLITLIPFKYNPAARSLTVYTEVEINITESGARDSNLNTPLRDQSYLNLFMSN